MLGPIVFGLNQDEILLPDLVLITQALPEPYGELVDKETYLKPGSRFSIGRVAGLELINPNGKEAKAEIAELGGDELQNLLSDTMELSKRHARVEVVDPWSIVVKDLGSKNGTYVLGDRHNPEEVRKQLRLVR